jgi:predicted transcriptional regulator
MDQMQLVTLAAEIVSAHVSTNKLNSDQLPGFVQQVHEALASLGQEPEEPQAKVPVVSIRASVRPDKLICMECGREAKMLKRHLMTAHNMTPADYKRDYGLPESYPMIAAEYGERRRDIAKQIGLGRKKGDRPTSKAKGGSNKAKRAGDDIGQGGGGGPDAAKSPLEAGRATKKTLRLFG